MARMPGEPDVAVVAATVEPEIPSSVDWRAVLAGAIVASAISFVLFTFGAGLGLSLTSPYPREGVSVTAFGIVLALWILWVSVTSFFASARMSSYLPSRTMFLKCSTRVVVFISSATTSGLGSRSSGKVL